MNKELDNLTNLSIKNKPGIYKLKEVVKPISPNISKTEPYEKDEFSFKRPTETPNYNRYSDMHMAPAPGVHTFMPSTKTYYHKF